MDLETEAFWQAIYFPDHLILVRITPPKLFKTPVCVRYECRRNRRYSRSFPCSLNSQPPAITTTINGNAMESTNPFAEDSPPIRVFISPQNSYFGSEGSTIGSDHDSLPGTVPPEHLYRTLVLCFDGTGDQYVQLHRLPFSQLTTFLQIRCRCMLPIMRNSCNCSTVPPEL